MTTRVTGRRRRPALVAGAVVTLAVASAAGSLVPGATAAPPPVRAADAPAVVKAAVEDRAAGLNARSRDGRVVKLAPAAEGRDRRLAPSAPARASGEAAAVTAAAAAVVPPTYSALGNTGLVVSSSRTLTFAPDGSRFAWTIGVALYSARTDRTGLLRFGTAPTPSGLAWSPDGRFVGVDSVAASTRFVIPAAHGQRLELPLTQGSSRVVSWLSPTVIVALQGTPPRTFAVSPLMKSGGVSYEPGADNSVVDAVASPDGTRVAAHIRTVGGSDSVAVVDAATLRKVATVVPATGATLGRPAWSPDSATVYVPRTRDGKTSIVSHAADTADGEPTVVLEDATATPNVYLRPTGAGKATGTRFTGRDAVAVSVARSKDAFAVARAGSCDVVGGATAAVLAASGSVEATIGAPLAANKCGPLLLTGKRSLDGRTAAELKRLLSRGRTVYLVGNTNSLSASVATAVTRLGFKAVRYGGADVYTTAVVVATKGWKDHSVAGIASASQPLAAAVASATTVGSVPLLLTKGTAMPKVTNAYITKYDTAAFAVGSQGAKAAPWAYKYVGANDVATALKVATGDYWPAYTVALVGTRDLSYVYAAAADATLRGHPLLYVAPASLGTPNRTYISETSASVDRVYLFASAKLVSSAVLTDAVKQAAGRR